MDKKYYYNSLVNACKACNRCELSQTRKQAVVGRTLWTGETNLNARLMLIGEAPGYHEDETGLPFIGSAGEVLQDIIDHHDLTSQIYVTNIVKCRPPDNRDPEPHEIESCSPYLRAQIRIIRPNLIVGLGRHSARFLLGDSNPKMGSLVGNDYIYIDTERNLHIPVKMVYHPATVLYRRQQPGYHEFRQEYYDQWLQVFEAFEATKSLV